MSCSLKVRGLVALVLGTATVSCGGGGGGSGSSLPTSPPSSAASVTGNGLAPSSGPGDASSYFPAGQGDTWSFNSVTTDSTAPASTGILKLTVGGTKTINGVPGTVFTRSDPTSSGGGYDQYYSVTSGGVSLLGNNDPTDTITPLIVPYAQLLFPVQVGPVSTISGKNLPFGKDSSGNAITLNLNQTIVNAATESVDVPAGTFGNVIRQTTDVSATAYDSGQSSPAITGNQTTWIAPGVGEIKEQISITGAGNTKNSSAELRGYAINGQRHGLGEPLDLVPALVNASCNSGSGNIARPSLSSDGTDYLMIVHQCDGSSGTAQYKWIAVLAGPDGTIQHSVDLSASVSNSSAIGLHSVVAFDGTNYLIVYEDDATATHFATPNLVAVLLSPAGTIVSGPSRVGVSSDDTNTGGSAQALAFDGTRYLLTYVDSNAVARPPQLSGLFISPATGRPDGVPFPISNTAGSHLQPAMAFDGTNYLVVWIETGASPPGLVATRVSAAGTVLDATPLLLMDNSAAATSGSCCDLQDLEPTVSFDGTNYLVAYRDTRGAPPYANQAKVSAARVSPGGTLLDGSATTPGIAVAVASGTVIGSVQSAFVNGALWIVWSSGIPAGLTASRVSSSGTVPSAWANGFSLVAAGSSSDSNERWPMIASAAQAGGLVAWLHLQGTQSPTTTALRALPIFQ